MSRNQCAPVKNKLSQSAIFSNKTTPFEDEHRMSVRAIDCLKQSIDEWSADLTMQERTEANWQTRSAIERSRG